MFKEDGSSPNLKETGPNSDDIVPPRSSSARFSGLTIWDTQGSTMGSPYGRGYRTKRAKLARPACNVEISADDLLGEKTANARIIYVFVYRRYIAGL
jgi:hypothetical protein